MAILTVDVPVHCSVSTTLQPRSRSADFISCATVGWATIALLSTSSAPYFKKPAQKSRDRDTMFRMAQAPLRWTILLVGCNFRDSTISSAIPVSNRAALFSFDRSVMVAMHISAALANNAFSYKRRIFFKLVHRYLNIRLTLWIHRTSVIRGAAPCWIIRFFTTSFPARARSSWNTSRANFILFECVFCEVN